MPKSKIIVDAVVTGPKNIQIVLVRGDHVATSNIFRICFEVGLVILGSILGAMIELASDDKPIPAINKIYLAITIIASCIFLWLTHSYSQKAKSTDVIPPV